MIHIKPIEYPTIIKRTFSVVSISTDKKKIEIGIASTNLRLYYGKRMLFFIGNVKYYGVYSVENIRNTIKHYLILSSPISGISVGNELVTYETFVVAEDNNPVTFQDIYERCNATESEVTEFGEKNIGMSGFVTGLDKLKLGNLIYDFKKDLLITLTNSFTTVCNLRLPKENTLANYRLMLYSGGNFGLFAIDLTVNYDGSYCFMKVNSHMLQESNKDEYKNIKNTINLKLNNILYNNGERFMAVNIGLDINNNVSEVYNFIGYIGCKSANDLLTPSVPVSESTPMLLNGSEYIECDKTLISADTYGEQRSAYWKETLFQGAIIYNLTLISAQKPGHYVCTGSFPSDIPGGATDDSKTGENKDKKFTIDYSKFSLVIYPSSVVDQKNELLDNRCLLITNNQRIFIGTINRTKNNVAWNELTNSNHTHAAKDIITDSEHLYVTQIEKDAWDKGIGDIANNPWRPTVQNEASLPKNPTEGYTVTVLKSTTFTGLSVIYQYLNNTWIPVSINIIPVMATTPEQVQYTNGGTLVDRNFIVEMQGSGIGKQLVKGNEQFISVLNSTTLYPTSAGKRFFDLVKRTITTNPEDSSINIGFDNGEGGVNSVSLGSNLKTISNNSINIGIGLLGQTKCVTLGNYNENIGNALFNLGIGTMAIRKSALYIDFNNNLILKNDGMFTIYGVDSSMLLTSGGVISKDYFVPKHIFDAELEKKADANKFGFFKHETYDGSPLESIVFISGLYSDYKKYDI